MQWLICVSLRDVLRDDFLIEISIVFVIVATLGNESPRRINGNCLKLKAESCRRITFGRIACYDSAGRRGRFGTGLPAAFFAQYPLPGRGILSFLQTFARPTSDRLYFLATVCIASDQISL